MPFVKTIGGNYVEIKEEDFSDVEGFSIAKSTRHWKY